MPPEDRTSDSDLESVISIQQHHQKFSNIKSTEPQTATESEKYFCEQCKISFKRSTNLDRHEFQHTGVKKHICSFSDCQKSYVIITHLKRHIKTFHEKFIKPKTFKCLLENCTKMFDSQFNMERHMRQLHENPKTYNCQQCSKNFQRKIQLKRHEVKHTGQFPFSCQKCTKGFIQQIHLDRHKCSAYKCEICSVVYQKWSKLVEHKKAEHPKPHRCQQCNKVFEQKSLLKTHQEIHKKQPDREVFQCVIEGCPKFYYHSKNLKHHMKVKHEGKKFKCPIDGCVLELATKQKLNSHIFVIHQSGKNLKKLNSAEKKPKKTRSDSGKPKRSMATKLSGIIADREIEKAILSGQGANIEIPKNFNATAESSAGTESEMEENCKTFVELKEIK